MFKLDHLMVEVDEPEIVAISIAKKFGLPFAWPLTETADYSSVGINFGDINIEFIKFRKRFGISDTQYSGFSGIAFAVDDSESECQEYLIKKGLACQIGERTEAYTTITVEELEVYPTVFLVKYHFDTSDWKKRLKSEFHNSKGGTYGIMHFESLEVKPSNPCKKDLFGEFGITSSMINRITFSGDKSQERQTINNISNLEIVIA